MGFKIKKPQFQIAGLNNLAAKAMSNFNTTMEDFWAKELARKKAIRGSDAYDKVMHDRYKINRPYYKSKNKKNPYLMSRHNMDGNMTDPMDPNMLWSIDNPSTLGVSNLNTTQREYDKYIQDRLAQLSLKGLNKQQLKEFEHNAKVSSNLYDNLILGNDISESNFNTNLKNVAIANPWGAGGATYNALGGPGNQVKYNNQLFINDLKNLHERASKTQDYSDQFRNVLHDFDDWKRKTNNGEIIAPELEFFNTELVEREKKSPGTIKFETLKLGQ